VVLHPRLRSPHRLLLAAAALASIALAAVAPPPARAAAPGIVLTGAQFDAPQALDAVSRSGVGWVRIYLYRNAMEPRPGVLDPKLLAAYRAAIGRYLWQGVRTEVVLVGTPAWESGSADALAAPDPAGFARFARLVAAALPDVGAYEVWQEADAQLWWPAGPDPSAYAELLRQAYPALKEGSGGAATVVLGGLTGNDAAFLDQLYAAGAGGAFDAVSVHTDTACGIASPYSYYRDTDGAISRWSFLGYRNVLASMAAHGDAAKQLWFTEFGWSSSQATCDQGVWAGQKAGGVSEDEQAAFLRQAFHCIDGDARIGPAFWFGLTDAGAADTPDNRFGMLRPDWSEKPAFAALTAQSRQGDEETGPCGDFTGPTISVLAVGDRGRHGRHAGSLHVSVRAADPQSVSRISLLLDGRRVRTFGTAGPVMDARADLAQAKRLSRGRHTLTIVARDANGNVTSRAVPITKTAAAARRRGAGTRRSAGSRRRSAARAARRSGTSP
jgi:hypothetical protein